MDKKVIHILTPDHKHYSLIPEKTRKYILDNTARFNELGEDFSHTPDGVEVRGYIKNNVRDLRGKAIVISFVASGFAENEEFLFRLRNKEGSFAKEIRIRKRRIRLTNLFPNETYFYSVSSLDGEVKSEERSFSILDEYRFIYTPHSINIRDVGGKKVEGNKVIRYGLFFRGAELTTENYTVFNPRDDHGSTHYRLVYPGDIPYLYDLGIKVDLDLRGDLESGNLTECPISSIKYPIDYIRIPIEAYQPFFITGIEKETVKEAYRRIFHLFAEADKKPVYIHCWGGADRTGTICFLLEALLGVSLKDLVIDYELTHFCGNRVDVKPYDPSYHRFWHEHTNFYLMHLWILDYLHPGETLQEGMRRYLVKEIGVKEETIRKIERISLKNL